MDEGSQTEGNPQVFVWPEEVRFAHITTQVRSIRSSGQLKAWTSVSSLVWQTVQEKPLAQPTDLR